MMGALREWLTSVVAVTLLLSVVQTLLPEGSVRKAASFTGGLVLLLALLRPALGADLGRIRLDTGAYAQALEESREALSAAGEDQLAAGIAERTQAYISDKADALGLRVTVRVETRTEGGVPLPWAAEITGPWSGELAAYMEEALGIPRERQVWHEGNG